MTGPSHTYLVSRNGGAMVTFVALVMIGSCHRSGFGTRRFVGASAGNGFIILLELVASAAFVLARSATVERVRCARSADDGGAGRDASHSAACAGSAK